MSAFPNEPSLKLCPDCKTAKPLDEFYKNKSAPGGLNTYCKPCWKARMAVSNAKHIDRKRETNRRGIAKKRAENPGKYKSEYKKWYDARGLEYHRTYQSEHRANSREASKAWRESHPDESKIGVNQSRCLKDGIVPELTVEAWRAITAKHDNCCARCGERKKLTIDHIIPLSKGGTDSPENVQPLCLSCNQSKGNKILPT